MKNREKVLAAITFLLAVGSMMSNELSGLISTDNVRLTRHTVFVRKDVTNAGGAIRIIDENTKKIDGVSSLSETKLPKNQTVIFDKIAIGFAEGDAVGKAGALDYTSAKAPAILRNANIVITQNGREVLDLPLADLTKVTSPTSQDDYYHDLEGFNFLVDDQPMEWVLRFPNGEVFAPAAGKFNYIEVRLQGFKSSRKQ